MPQLYDRLEIEGGHPRIRGSDTSIVELVELLEGSKTPLQVVTGLGIDGVDLVAALAFEALRGDEALGLPLVQGEPTRPDLLDSVREPSLAILYPRTPKPIRLALSAGLLQIFDFWEESHIAAQEADDLGERGSAAYWHGIAHRREPDFNNAAYWFRRVGRHAILPEVAAQVDPFLAAGAPAWAGHLVVEGRWDPLAFSQACRALVNSAGDDGLARKLQRREMLALLGLTVLDLV